MPIDINAAKALIAVRITPLRNGHTKSCGCSRAKDLRGQRFGRLLALYRVVNSDDEMVQWRCLCSCGTFKIVKAQSLHDGVKSCGCLRAEAARVNQRKAIEARRVA